METVTKAASLLRKRHQRRLRKSLDLAHGEKVVFETGTSLHVYLASLLVLVASVQSAYMIVDRLPEILFHCGIEIDVWMYYIGYCGDIRRLIIPVCTFFYICDFLILANVGYYVTNRNVIRKHGVFFGKTTKIPLGETMCVRPKWRLSGGMEIRGDGKSIDVRNIARAKKFFSTLAAEREKAD